MEIQLATTVHHSPYAGMITPCQAGPSTCTPLPGSFSIAGISRQRIGYFKNPSTCKRHTRRCWAAIGKAPASKDKTSNSAKTSSLKAELLRASSGLDRGIAASTESSEDVEQKAAALERAGRTVDLSEDLERMQGLWKLVYSSGFLSGSLGGRRPGPEIGRTPIKLGEVYQRIDVSAAELDNIVTLDIVGPWPIPAIQVTATLAHSLQTFGKSGVRIIFEKTYVKGEGGLKNWPQLTAPQLPSFLKPPSSVGSGEFTATYVDDDMRITRGDRGELRVFIRA